MAERASEAKAYVVLPTGPMPDNGQVWAWQAWAVGPRNQAVKLYVMKDHGANPTEAQELKTQASGLYRRQYHQWCKGMDFSQEYRGGKPIQETLA